MAYNILDYKIGTFGGRPETGHSGPRGATRASARRPEREMHVYVYAHIYIYIYIYIHIHTYTRTYIYIYIYIYTHVYVLVGFRREMPQGAARRVASVANRTAHLHDMWQDVLGLWHLWTKTWFGPDPVRNSCCFNALNVQRTQCAQHDFLWELWKLFAQSPYCHCGFQGAWLKHYLNLKGWNSQAHREFPGMLESSNVSREMGRIGDSKSHCEWAPSPHEAGDFLSSPRVRRPADRTGLVYMYIMYVYIYIYIHTYIHTYVNILYIHVYIHIYIYT